MVQIRYDLPPQEMPLTESNTSNSSACLAADGFGRWHPSAVLLVPSLGRAPKLFQALALLLLSVPL